MNTTLINKPLFRLTNIAGLMLLATLSACGGGGSASGEQAIATPDAVVTPPASNVTFRRMNFGFTAGKGEDTGIDQGATIDAAANITFVQQIIAGQPPASNFTFPSGLPGGSVIASHVFSIATANKNIMILAPNANKTVQNVFVRNTDDTRQYEFALAGYQTDLAGLTWPASGAATYTGKAFQKIFVDTDPVPQPGWIAGGTGLYSSDVVAKVDYANKKITITVGANPVLIESSGAPLAIDPGKFLSTITFTDVTYAQLNNNRSFPEESTELGLVGGSTLPLLRFFGSNAEEMGGIFIYGGFLKGLGSYQRANQMISFALRKQ